ncbi:MAG: glycosyltransferase, partial [Acidimicrobiia bacterium]|nr:glycosyltransferase [Acidimicrobiia bacterium]
MAAARRTGISPPAARVALSAVVPVFNSAPVVSTLCGRLVSVLERVGGSFEIVLVDDGSSDASWTALAAIARADTRVAAIRLAGNHGGGYATLAGLRHTAGDVVIMLNDDLQHLPEAIPALLAALAGPPARDVVFGRSRVRYHRAWRKAASLAIDIVAAVSLRKPLAFRFTSFLVARRECVSRVLALPDPAPAVPALFLGAAARIGVLTVPHGPSALGGSATPRPRSHGWP